MPEVEEKVVRLQVGNMRPQDCGRGLARVADSVFETLGISEGDISMANATPLRSR